MAGFKGSLDNYFGITKSGSKFSTEIIAGVTTFFTMAYIMFVNPNILSVTGMPRNAVFLATIFAAVIGTLVMALFANVPYAQAPGMGLNAFFTFVVCDSLGFVWQQALAMVFICGIINILITVTKVRKHIIKAIPKSLQFAIGGGIGVFIAYIGFLNAGLINLPLVAGGVPEIAKFATADTLIAIGGLILVVILLILKVKGAILISILAATVVSIIAGAGGVDTSSLSNINAASWGQAFKDLGTTFGAAFGSEGMGSLFSDLSKLPVVLLAIFAFSLSDTFDTIGTFIGTGRKSGIFSDDEIYALENSKGFKSKMDKALFADSIATSVGAIFGTSNTTTYVESAAGIEAGGKTGFTSVITAILFLACILISPIAKLVPNIATAPALIVVGIMMMSAFKEIDWHSLEEAIPAFFAAILMALAYNISIGIAFGFIFYCIVKLCKGQIKEVHPILWGSAILFVLYFVLMGLQGAGIIA
jgi:AGZA family xanthine/uracil permease-like MFS transporter